MMLEKYRAATRAIRRSVARHVTRMLGVPQPRGRDGLFRVLHETGHCQADLVLCLLRLDALREAEALVGRRITVCPPCLRLLTPPLSLMFEGDRLVIRRLQRNPCLPTTPAFQRYRILREGMTVDQVRRRGVKSRDLRVWGRRGYFKLERRA